MIITIDGPTASGKSIIARTLAQKLGFYYLPTGWFYRAVAYLLVQKCNYTEDMLSHPKEDDVAFCLDPTRLVYTYDSQRGGALFFDEVDITVSLKDYKVDRYVAIISPIVIVRNMIVQAQCAFSKTHDSVIEGRDIGSVVFPNAHYKFYLTASLAIRAQRWQKDQAKRGNKFTQKQAKQEISERDEKDMNRKISPLMVPKGAIEIDNSTMNIERTVQVLLKTIRQ